MKDFISKAFNCSKKVVLKLYWGILLLFIVAIVLGFIKPGAFIRRNIFFFLSFLLSIWGTIRLVSLRFGVLPFQYDRLWSILGTKKLTQEERSKKYRDICLRNATIAWLAFILCMVLGIVMEVFF